jgi:hypothetical protein
VLLGIFAFVLAITKQHKLLQAASESSGDGWVLVTVLMLELLELLQRGGLVFRRIEWLSADSRTVEPLRNLTSCSAQVAQRSLRNSRAVLAASLMRGMLVSC